MMNLVVCEPSSSERRTDRKAAAFLARSVPCCAPTVPGRSGAGVHRSIARRPRTCSEELPDAKGEMGVRLRRTGDRAHPTAWRRAARTPPRRVVPPALVGQHRLEHRQRDHDRGRQPPGRDHDHRSDRHRRRVRRLRHPDPGLRAGRRERHRPDRPPAPADRHGRGSPRHRPGGRAAPGGWGRRTRPLLPRVGGRRGRHAPLRRHRECGRGRGDPVRPPRPGEQRAVRRGGLDARPRRHPARGRALRGRGVAAVLRRRGDVRVLGAGGRVDTTHAYPGAGGRRDTGRDLARGSGPPPRRCRVPARSSGAAPPRRVVERAGAVVRRDVRDPRLLRVARAGSDRRGLRAARRARAGRGCSRGTWARVR